MDNVSHFLPDVNDVIDRRQADEDAWERDAQGGGYIPAQIDRLVEGGMAPEDAADVVDFLADPLATSYRNGKTDAAGADASLMTFDEWRKLHGVNGKGWKHQAIYFEEAA